MNRGAAPWRRTLYRLAASAAAVSFLYGLWRVLVHDDRHPGLFWQLVFPLIILRLSLTLYRRAADRSPFTR